MMLCWLGTGGSQNTSIGVNMLFSISMTQMHLLRGMLHATCAVLLPEQTDVKDTKLPLTISHLKRVIDFQSSCLFSL